jgi:hypothetical protein
MIKKLKRKFILIFMSVTTLMLLGVFVFVGIYTYHNLEKECKNTLTNYLSTSVSPHKKVQSSSIVLSIKYSDSGREIEKNVNDNLFTLSDEEIEEISSYCLTAKKSYGKVSGKPYAYMRRTDISGKSVALYDLTETHRAMRTLCISFLVAGICAIFIFYIISFFLSRWCIRPIEESWNKQQKFVADASHELKTPLTVILANLSLLRSELKKIQPTSEKYLEYIEEETRHMSRLVNDMLFLAKTDALQEDFKQETVNFSEICLNSYLSFESVAYEKGIQMSLDSDEEDLIVSGSCDKLHQLCEILLDNACKYTEEKGNIHISLHHKGNMLSLKVNNSGTPIPKSKLPHLFERFYRVDESRTRSGASYGLGLSIAESIVTIHHGKITVDSSPADGTTFHVKLPITNQK